MNRIEEIKQRLSAATPGDWIHLGENDPDSIFWGEIRAIGTAEKETFILIAEMPDLDDRTEDFNFIAHAKEDVPWLLDEVERLWAEVGRLKAKGVVLDMLTAKPLLDFLEECIPDYDIFNLFLELRDAIEATEQAESAPN